MDNSLQRRKMKMRRPRFPTKKMNRLHYKKIDGGEGNHHHNPMGHIKWEVDYM